eukprot:CAMPEP_0170534494 /NCGR_PEP_ID=MMETSP0209-20121228/91911_1 /TAXON_ID=665100 ORGANISM="Litonotus pictus, Strain P1" /NCGR_SAMPLE_ID=MMETSP0209 /ASSEMBLY_ACC=CAM_ASM_000301 /LENGTH=103 /DNA_ID=CAMNT_0010833969 /DNA_START=141 /DNA_END=449 /DNA_ORIENTATION=+
MEKVNDKFEYYNNINLGKYLGEDEESPENEYELHAVVVHSGNLNTGHYYCYINTHDSNPEENSWIKFNDEYVRKCSQEEAVDSHYGGKRTIVNLKEDGNTNNL